jgi:hypothetical protein
VVVLAVQVVQGEAFVGAAAAHSVLAHFLGECTEVVPFARLGSARLAVGADNT